MSTVDDLSKQILADLVADFRAKDLGTSALSEGYVGLSIVALGVKYCADEQYSKVDFDLALKQIRYDDKNRNRLKIKYLLHYDIYMEKGEMIRIGGIERAASGV